MPALDNPRHEAFAWAIIEGLCSPDSFQTQAQAYKRVYTRVEDNNVAHAAASRLLNKVKPIMARVRELQAEQIARLKPKLDLSKERVGRRLNLASEIAEAERNASAIATSEMGIAKVFGHITEKSEVKLSTDYSSAKSENDIGKQLLVQVGFDSPDASSIALAVEANRLFVDRLIEIRDQAAATLELTAATD